LPFPPWEPRLRPAKQLGPDAPQLAARATRCSLVDLLARRFADHRVTVDSFQLDTAHPDIRALTGFGRDHAGYDIRDAVAVAHGAVTAEDLDAAIVKAARAKGWSERRVGGR
jgi:hypothetical protein